MRKLLLIPVLFLLLSLAAVAQDNSLDLTPIPADKIATAAKPFLGTFDGISCEGDSVVGLRFKFAQSAPNEAPDATLLQASSGDKISDLNLAFATMDFSSAITPDGDTTIYLGITNGRAIALLSPYKGVILGFAYSQSDPTPRILMLAPTTGDLLTFVKTHAELCSSKEARTKFMGDLDKK